MNKVEKMCKNWCINQCKVGVKKRFGVEKIISFLNTECKSGGFAQFLHKFYNLNYTGRKWYLNLLRMKFYTIFT